MTEVILEKPLFASTHEALAFAFNYTSNPPGPLVNRLGGSARPEGRGLHGEAGAAQSGMILRRLQELDPLHYAVLRARYGPMTRDCSCCGQPAPHYEWASSIRLISGRAMHLFNSMHSVTDALVYALVSRFYARDKTPLEDIGSKCGVSLSTASRANGDLSLWLRGPKRAKQGEPGKGVDAVAFAEADRLLTCSGFIN